ncbi:hypothetical protein LOZ12_000058 [Ophidiomyces ophidiicola]|uniref:Uncharacterized protein n=1 Tax=Ophidiomyces ophidiicola TaxID=1387563 RepID=A0ACB8V8J5_9EURO|nr:uncharacterized protein LOZ57_006069 [Ophidiomyces ophidiicola]KAI1923599.1 hypothetical protein LOZ64_000856 [Ophidiomyces ophidiicola]KAI1939785.1 hypothetical protein LOZ57_006069 [Ophidiomyces ophidiicola]KAI1956149.1 hypothetical protein LOZ62_000143 [Ophidiomyces ophidiicola]KAI1967832.1 hypothetical protein LOZ59_000649 [Ophidiomyces ophidiicola]KAI1975282.1 hypothetical protein LOZ56_000808 [Ophidiomyces ophidiicola]
MPSFSSNSGSSAPPVPGPSNPVLLAAQSQWLFTDAELLRTPSALDGMAVDSEHMSRGKGVNFIMQVGILLKLPQLTLCTASVYLHRFFMRYSMVDLPQRSGMHPYSVAATSLFLATKVEENCRKMRELIIACCRVALKKPNVVVDEQSKEFWKWRDTILHNEDLLLEALCFDLQYEQPYRLLYDFLCYFKKQNDKPLRNSAWAFVNDSIYTVLCLQFTSRKIAAGALYAAARHCNASFPDDDAGRPWWEQLDVNHEDLKRTCNKMAEFYEKSPIPKPGLNYPSVSGNEEESTDRTRHPARKENENSEDHDADDSNGSLSPGEISERKRDRDEGEISPTRETTTTGVSPSSYGKYRNEERRSPKRQKRDEDECHIPPNPSSRHPQSQTHPLPLSNTSPNPLPANGPKASATESNNPIASHKAMLAVSASSDPHRINRQLDGQDNTEQKKPPDFSPARSTTHTATDKPWPSHVPASYHRHKDEMLPRPPSNLPPKPPIA